MATFTDKKGTDWKLELSVGLVEDIKEKTETDLGLLLRSPDKFAEFLQEMPHKFVEMLYIMCEDQIKQTVIRQKDGTDTVMTPRDFGRLFGRETLDLATNAMLEAIVSFYPRASAGKALKKKLPQILAKMDQAIEENTEKALDKELLNMPTG